MARNRYYEDESSREGIDSQLLKRLLQFCKPYKKRFIVCFGIMLCSVAVSLGGPLINKYLLNDVLMPASNWPLGIVLICAMASVFLLQPIINVFRDVAVSWLGQKIIFDIRRSLFAHLQRLTFKFYDDRPAGKILVRVTSYIDGLAFEQRHSAGAVRRYHSCGHIGGAVLPECEINPCQPGYGYTPYGIYSLFQAQAGKAEG